MRSPWSDDRSVTSARVVGPRPAGGLRRRRGGGVDPFCALEVQCALSRIDAEIVALTTRDDDRFARGHHLVAARLAFDQLLDEACRLAEVTDLPEPGPVRRMVAEAELRLRGWSW